MMLSYMPTITSTDNKGCLKLGSTRVSLSADLLFELSESKTGENSVVIYPLYIGVCLLI